MARRKSGFEQDKIRVKHMLDASSEAITFAKARTRKELDRNRMLAMALLKEIEVIGEAANRLTDEFCAAYPDIPWKDIIATRNRLVHGYFDIDLDIVWNTVKQDLPALRLKLMKIIKSPS